MDLMGLQVLAGPPTQLMLTSQPGCERLAVSNGTDDKSRLLLDGAALQLVDEHGNASNASEQRVRISLRWPAEEEGVSVLGTLLPDIQL